MGKSLRRFTHLDNGRSSGSTPSTAPRCGYTQQYLTDRLKEAQTTALAQFGDFFFKTTEEAPTTEFKRLVGTNRWCAAWNATRRLAVTSTQ